MVVAGLEAVTGLALPQALRASHAKPWAECASDAERLDVLNGFLLSANLGVLFDSFLVSLSEEGELTVSKSHSLKRPAKAGAHRRHVIAVDFSSTWPLPGLSS